MTDRINDGGPAFPKPLDPYPNVQQQIDGSGHVGMSKRDYFAALAMHAELNTAGQHLGAAKALAKAALSAGQSIEQRIAFNAYRVADAMIAAAANTPAGEP